MALAWPRPASSPSAARASGAPSGMAVTVIESNMPDFVKRSTNWSCRPTPRDTIPDNDAIPIDTPATVSAVLTLA